MATLREEEQVLIDLSDFPLVVTVLPARPVYAMVDDYMERMEKVAARGRYVVITDMRPMKLFAVDTRTRVHFGKQAGAFMAGPGNGRMLGEGVVMNGAVARQLITAYSWMRTTRHVPIRTFSSLQEARAWAIPLLEEAGLAVPQVKP